MHVIILKLLYFIYLELFINFYKLQKMKKLQKMSFVSASKLSRNEMRTVMAGCAAEGGTKCCNDSGKCSECTAGAVVCSGTSHAVDC